MKTTALHRAALWAAISSLPLVGAPPGPDPQIPEGGGAPGAYPNTSVTAVNVQARGSDTFDGRVDVAGFDGQGPVAWSVNRYNRGDIALRLAPADPVAALGSIGLGFTEFADTAVSLAANQAWRPHPARGVVIPTIRRNGPITWPDGEGAFFPAIAISESSSGPGYSMVDGSYGNGNLDINTGRMGGGGSSGESNFDFSATWFPYDQGWLGGEVGTPVIGDPNGILADGTARWTGAGNHAGGLSAGLVQWLDVPSGSLAFGGHAALRLPGVNTLEDGMLFVTSSDGSSDVNIAGVAPREDGSAWLVTIREASSTDATTLADAGQSEFQFVYVPFDAERLVGGHIVGATGAKRKAAGEFGITRTATGTYELTLAGKTGADGTLLLQAADLESGTPEPLATRAVLSYAYADGKFVIQARKATGPGQAPLADVNFYVAWVDFTAPLAPPAGPALRTVDAVLVNGDFVTAREAGVAAHATLPEALAVTVDFQNVGGFTDPITGQFATAAVVGRFYDTATLAPTSDPFIIVGSPSGDITKTDVKFNPVTSQYVVVANGRNYTAGGFHTPLMAIVNPAASACPRIVKAWVHDPDTDSNYDDLAVAVSSANGNFLLAGEKAAAGEGESTVGSLYDSAGNRLTPPATRLDLLQSIGDEDDPDVVYLPGRNAFLYISNTDNSNGSTGTLGNRIVGSLVDTTPGPGGVLVVRTEQELSDGLPAGRAEGHPHAIENPFNGQLITAYDAGNNTAAGELAYFNLGTAPEFTFTAAGPEIPYLAGTDGNPFRHQHPQLEADPVSGTIVVGMNVVGSDIGLPAAYAVVILGPDGTPLPSQVSHHFVADAPGGISNSVSYQRLSYSSPSQAYLVAFNTGPGFTYLASFQVTSRHLASGEVPNLAVSASAGGVTLSWPADAAGVQLQRNDVLSATGWTSVTDTPTVEEGLNKVTLDAAGAAGYFRLARP